MVAVGKQMVIKTLQEKENSKMPEMLLSNLWLVIHFYATSSK